MVDLVHSAKPGLVSSILVCLNVYAYAIIFSLSAQAVRCVIWSSGFRYYVCSVAFQYDKGCTNLVNCGFISCKMLVICEQGIRQNN